MLWRVRTTLPDRPGALAELARRCGELGVNILGIQIFPGIKGVTDEVVLRAPDDWGAGETTALVAGAGGREVTVAPCSEHALVDAPTRYLHAARRAVVTPQADLPWAEVLAGLLDGEVADPLPDPSVHPGGTAPRGPAGRGQAALRRRSRQDELAVRIAARRLAVRRTAPFTATEHARAAAFADLVDAVLARTGPAPSRPDPRLRPVVRPATAQDLAAVLRMHARCSAESLHRRFGGSPPGPGSAAAERLVGPGSVAAVVGEDVVGLAALHRETPVAAEAVAGRGDDADVLRLGLLVEDAWQRRGLGAHLLAAAARQAATQGARELRVQVREGHHALLATLAAAGLRGRLRLDDGVLDVTVGLRGRGARLAGPDRGVPR